MSGRKNGRGWSLSAGHKGVAWFLSASARQIAVVMIACVTLQAFAAEKETVVRLVNEDRVLSTAMELHLTATDSALVNSIVSLNYEDAWLFFDNIKPSEVLAKYSSGIRINGEPLNAGANGRIAIYAQGSVIMPFGYYFKPLTVYTEEGCTGSSMELPIHIYHNNLGEFDDVIQSFRLKRGYMATFANSQDGSGYSRVFIADREDLVMDRMPAELKGRVSFIRIFKYEWVSKKGKAGWNPHDINATSYYDWNIGGNSSSDVEYVAIRQNGGWPSWNDINSKENISHLLGFNEPDRPDQANMTFQQMIDIWPDMMKSGLRIGSPAWSNPWGGTGGTLFDFIDKCDELNYRVDFVALHCYWGGKSPQNWYNDLKYIHERTGRPLWITEWNNGANWTTEWWPDASKAYTDANARKQLNDLKGILQVLDTASFVERYFIYDWVQDCRAMVLNGQLTLAGAYYSANKSQIAYNGNREVVPHWNYKPPVLSSRYFSLSNAIRVGWTDSNGELSRKYTLEKKVNRGSFETVYASEDVSKLFYLDPLDTDEGGTLTYRLTLVPARGIPLHSNRVTCFKTAGTDVIQSADFIVDNLEANTVYFSRKYSTVPLLFLGVPSFENAVPLTQRVTGVTTTSFRFALDPWLYVKNARLLIPEQLSVLAIPAGSYDFKGIKAEVGAISGVTRDWSAVTFNKHFGELPVVFCTLASGGNTVPLTVGIRNVTVSGFECCLKSEEALTASINGETVHFFAIEQGKGAIGGKRITVGRNSEGSGLFSSPVDILLDSSYREPAVFAGLLSAEDNFASTLRYSLPGESVLRLVKQRETSAGDSEIHVDQFGWMVMDLSAGQPDTVTIVPEQHKRSRVDFYPNPANHTVNFSFDAPIRVEVVDLTGHTLIDAVISRELKVNSLPRGVYILKAEGFLPALLVKTE